jgi:RHH-type proline utilization regulon transcriptional repressor/proline dehydrogenase/delta 1-pyrroline-5-carboxylate dehydrogenase
VCFTGSTQVAHIIHRTLAAKDGAMVPLIAETGGLNAMVVDSTALPEQVIDAVVMSAFRSAGQRCSALRLLCVHESIADGVIEMLRGAMAELVVGDPAELRTDVGPVIDQEAFDNLQQNIARLRREAKFVGETAVASRFPRLIAPIAFELPRIADLKQEIFGPVLHVVRWSGEPEAVVDEINALGYGLTFGIQTRIDSRALRLAERARIGNVYVNRNMIGAVVGVQPFGGEALSGTGPKAGGPHYLWRFVQPVPRAGATAPQDLMATRSLPGPTGESNELRLHPRGRFAVIGGDSAAMAAARRTLQQTGNELVEVAIDASLDAVLADAALAGVCVLDDTQVRPLWRRIAQRPGPILPVVTRDEVLDPTQAYRFCAEQTLTINTAAAGGNAALLAGVPAGGV